MIKCGICHEKFPEYHNQRSLDSKSVQCCPICGVKVDDTNANFTYDEDYPFDTYNKNKLNS